MNYGISNNEKLTAQDPEVQEWIRKGLTEEASIGNVMTARKRQAEQNQSSSSDVRKPINRPIIPTQSPYQKASKELLTRPEQPNYQDIKQQELDRAQQMIEATKGVYLSELQKLEQQGAERMGRTSSMAVGAGLAGSPFQQRQESKTQEYTGQIVGARKSERSAEIQRIMSDGDDKAEKRWQARRSEYMDDREAYLGMLEESQTEAKDTMKNLASVGVSLDEMAESDYTKLVEDSGYSKLQFDSYYNAMKPKEQQVSYDYKELKDGSLLRIGDDGSYETIKDATPIKDGYQLKQLDDGTLVQFNEDTGEIELLGEKGEYGKEKTGDEKISTGTDPITGATTDLSKVIAGFDFTSYAVDPSWGKSVKNILSDISKIKNTAEADEYIQNINSESVITANDIEQVAQEFDIPSELLTAIMQHESGLGNSNVAKLNNNFGGITWTGANGEKGSPRPSAEGGNYVRYSNPINGIKAIAENINKRRIFDKGYTTDILTARLGKQIYGTRISDKESDRVERFISAGTKQGKSEYEIIDDVVGFKVIENKELAESLRNKLLQYTTDAGLSGYDMLGLARLLNSNNKVGAVNKVEKEILNQSEDGISRETSANYAFTKGDDVTKKIEDNLNKLGIVRGNWKKLKKKFVKDKNFQSIESGLTALISEWRLKMAGSNITENETKFLSSLIGEMQDNPFNAMQKIKEFQEMNLQQLNSIRENYNLPLLDKESLLDKKKRVNLYVNGSQAEEASSSGTTSSGINYIVE